MARTNQNSSGPAMDAPWRRLLDEDDTDARARTCDWPGCTEDGEHRAPKSRETLNLNEYHWFCQPHAREYNTQWNYYDGMTEDEVEADRRRDTTWQRPSWHFGTINGGRAGAGFGFGPDNIRDDFGVYEDNVGGAHARKPQGPGAETPKGPAPGSPEAGALQTLDLHPPITAEKVKARYKEMVKRYHPDANGGDKAAEEKFKQIGEAYRILMAAC